jgi:hypothetical protein
MIEKGAVFPMFYLPPVEYFVKINRYKPAILIEREEHFPKQTYRNRANIYSPDGELTLTVPVIKGSTGNDCIGKAWRPAIAARHILSITKMN